MPSLPQLPETTTAGPTDKILLDQSGQSRSITVSTLQAGLQSQLTIAHGALLGRASVTPGQPEPINIGPGLSMQQGQLSVDTAVFALTTSPAFTGTPTAPTLPVTDSSTALATTAFVQAKTWQPLTLTGDVVGSASPALSGFVNATLPSITSPGSFARVTVNAKGQVTGGSVGLSPSDIAGLDTSAGLATAPGTATARSLGSRLVDRQNVLDVGADATGTIDFSTGFQALASGLPVTGGTIFFPRGTYRFDHNIYVPDKALIDIDAGVVFLGNGRFNTDVDTSVLLTQQAAKTLMRVASADANSFTLYVSQLIPSTTGNANYEKAALYAASGSYDASTYSHQVAYDVALTAKDAVGVQATGSVLPGNAAGRAWGLVAEAQASPGSDANLTGIEVDIINNGAAQPEVSRWNSKTGIHVVNLGPNAGTSGFQLTNGGAPWYDGYTLSTDAVSRYAFVLRDASVYPYKTPAYIDRVGNAQFASLSVNGNGVGSSFTSSWTAGNPGNGAYQWTFTGAVPNAGVIGPLTTIYNNGPHCAQAEKTQYFSQAGAADSVDNAQTLIGIYNPAAVAGANMGAELVRWTVGITPQDTAHNWTHVVEELNVVNRGLDMGWKAYRNDPANNIAGPQQVTGIHNYSPESTGLGQPGEGKNLLFAELFGQSAAPNSTGLPARFYNASLYEPNCVVGGTGRAIFINGDLTGVAAQVPYAPIEINLTWLHGLRTTTAIFQDGQAFTMATGQALAWANATSTASIKTSGAGANQDIVLSPAGVGTVRLPSATLSTLSAADSQGLTLGTSQGSVIQVKDNGAPALSRIVITPGNAGAPAIISVVGETNQGLNFRAAGGGQINFQSSAGGSTNALTLLANPTAVNALSISGGSTGQNVVLGVNGADPNVSIQISPQGSGTVYINKLQAAGGTIDGTPVGAGLPSTGAFTTLKATGVASFGAGLADASYSSQSPASGFSITIGNGVSTLQLTPSGPLASGNITMPTAPANGQWLLVASTASVAACSFTPAAGQTILGAPTTLPAFVEVAFQYHAGPARWVCQSGNDSRIANVATAASLVFGTGADASVIINSGTTTLTRDMHYTSLTLSGTGIINPAGWRIFVSGLLDLSQAAAGAIAANASPANPATGSGGGLAPSGLSQRTVGQSPQSGGAGGNGTSAAGNPGTPGASAIFGNGGNGGASGAGGAASAAGGAGAAGGAETVQIPLNTPTTNFWLPANNASLASGLLGGGGGGGGGDGTNAGGGGGSGGSFGGTVALYARSIQRGSNTTAALIQATGSAGGNGGAPATGNAAGGGGGGGGGGGLIYIVTEALLGSSIANALDVSGGAGGAGGSGLGSAKGGSGGAGGASGSVQIVNLTAPAFTSSVWNVAGSIGGTTASGTGATGGAGSALRAQL